jgi:lipopolysaccharide export system protein LptA
VNNLVVNECKGYTRQVIILAIIWLLLSGASHGQTAAPKDDAPVHIVSDKLEAYQQQQKVIFIGNVVAKQGELTIRGDRMTIYYLEKENPKPNLEKENPKPNEEGLAGKIDRIEVDGGVHITQKAIVATAEHVVYFDEENKIVLTGKPRVERGKDSIQGDKITLFLDSEKSVVEGGPSRPVEATIFSSTSGGPFDRASDKGK